MPQRSRTGRPSHGPLKPAHYFILLAIADGDQHGYAIRKSVDELSGGQVKLWPTTLYGSIHQLVDDGLIAELEAAPSPADDDSRRRYYRLTGLGHERLEAETARLASIVARAKAISHAR
jgi:DNA-binding PadR family transcriptional regulator